MAIGSRRKTEGKIRAATASPLGIARAYALNRILRNAASMFFRRRVIRRNSLDPAVSQRGPARADRSTFGGMAFTLQQHRSGLETATHRRRVATSLVSTLIPLLRGGVIHTHADSGHIL